MKLIKLSYLLFTTILLVSSIPVAGQDTTGKLHFLVIGAHPDDAEKAGRTMAKLIAKGHKVRLVSMTNGNAGHHEMGGGPLAQRHFKEAQYAGKVIGAEYVVMDNDNGKLMPTLENREKIIAQIREFNADVVITHRPNDYHPDHRNTGLLVSPRLLHEIPIRPRTVL